MALALWDGRYETGHLAIDTQHRHLFSLVNDLHEALMAGRGKQAMGDTLRALASYTAEHFRCEEALMLQMEFPGTSDHQRKHAQLVSQVRQLMADHDAGKLTLPLTLARFLSDWLGHHIEEEDMKLIEWVRTKNPD